MSSRKSNMYGCAVLLVFGFTAHAASSQAVKPALKPIAIPFDAQTVIKFVDKIKGIVGVCQAKANINDSLNRQLYQSAYSAAISKIEYERAASGLEIGEVDKFMAREEAQKSLPRADEKDSAGECKSKAKEGMDQEVKNLVTQFSSAGLGNQVKGFMAAWYTALESVGTERFKDHQIRMESLAEELKLEAIMRSGK